MSRVHGKGTSPEILVRKRLFSHGFRYRVNVSSLPGSPDIVLKKHNAVIFVNGCFWHGHKCGMCRMPATNGAYWKKKIEGNWKRDLKNVESLLSLGWRVCVVWECSLKMSIRARNELGFIGDLESWIVSEADLKEF